MAHARHVVESWDDDDDSFALPSNDPNPLRLGSVNSSVAFADGEDDETAAGSRGGFSDVDDDDDFGWARVNDDRADLAVSLRSEDDEDDRLNTIKASASSTLKLPTAPASGMRTITSLDQVASLAVPVPTTILPASSSSLSPPDRGLSAKLSTASLSKSFTLPSSFEMEVEDDFALPDSMSHLSLRPLRTQTSSASFASSTSTSAQNTSWGNVPSSAHSNVPSLVKDGSEAATSSDVGDHDFLPEEDGPFNESEADDFGLDGIVLPDPLFFTRANSTLHLKTLLEAKSKGGAASTSSSAAGSLRNGGHLKRASDTVRIASGRDQSASEDSFEAGLVLDGDSQLLSAARLKTVKARTARARTLPLPKGARPKPGSTTSAALTLPGKQADEDWTKELERGWGRPKSPLPRHPRSGSGDTPPPMPASSAAGIGKGRPSAPSRSNTASLAVSSTPPSTLRRERSQVRLDAGSSTTSSPPLAMPSPSTSPVFNRYPGSYAQGLLSRKASLPHLSLDSTDDTRSSSPSNLGRFAAPTASSLARKRERPERSSIVNQELYSPPSAASRSATPLLTISPSAVIGSRLTMPTSSSRQKARAPISHSTFTTSPSPSAQDHHRTTGSFSSSTAVGPRPPKIQTRPKGDKRYGDGTELDALEDLSVDAEKERLFRVPDRKDATKRLKAFPSMAQILHSRSSSPVTPVNQSSRTRNQSTLTASTASSEMKRKKAISSTSTSSASLAAEGVLRKPNKRPALKVIKNLGGADHAKVQGGMTYNPKTYRWEGNESALQAFEPALASARPALITHLTGTSISSLGSPLHGSTQATSAPAPAISARVVGHMQFDPIQMRWISLLGKDEDEPDPFASIDDDDGDVYMDGHNVGRPSSGARRDQSQYGSMDVNASDLEPPPLPRPAVSLADYIRRGPDEFDLGRRCRTAEEGHRAEIAQWALGTSAGGRGWKEKERGHLWEIRKVALRAGREDRFARSMATTNDDDTRTATTTTTRPRPK